MQDLLNIIDNVINEASGGMAKRWLESQKSPIYWLDAQGNRYTIDNLVLLPEKTPSLPAADLQTEIENSAQALGLPKNSITYVNRMPNKGAAMLVVMKNQNNQKLPYLKYFGKRTMDNLGMHWSPSDFEKETGLAWQQTRMTGSGKDRKEEVISRINLKPLFAVPTNVNMSIQDVPKQSAAMLSANPAVGSEVAKKLQKLLENTLAGKDTPVAGLAPYERDIRVDFGEVATPLGLVAGKFVGGDYNAAQQNLLTPLGISWNTATQVFYPAAGNEPLYDSQIMWSNGEKLRISNKAEGKGGAASTTSILEIIDRYPERFDSKDKKMLSPNGKYGKIIKALRTIVSVKSYEGPVRLAQEFGFISQDDADNALENLQNRTNNIKLLTPKLRSIIKDQSIFNAKTNLPDYKVCYHVIASLARMVVKHLNSDMNLTTDFFKFMLSRANLVQVNQFTTRKDDGVAYTKFDVVWPPVFTGKIKFSASDFQGNKKPTSRLAFSVGNQRGAGTSDIDTSLPEPTPIATTADLDKVITKPRLTGPGVRAAKLAQRRDNDSETTLGRTKRKR